MSKKPPKTARVAFWLCFCYHKSMDISSISSIIVAVISATGGVIGAYVAVQKGDRDKEIKDAQREQWQKDQFEAINHKLDIHNGYAEKLGDMSRSMVAMQKDIEFLKGK